MFGVPSMQKNYYERIGREANAILKNENEKIRKALSLYSLLYFGSSFVPILFVVFFSCLERVWLLLLGFFLGNAATVSISHWIENTIPCCAYGIVQLLINADVFVGYFINENMFRFQISEREKKANE